MVVKAKERRGYGSSQDRYNRNRLAREAFTGGNLNNYLREKRGEPLACLREECSRQRGTSSRPGILEEQ